MIIKSEFTAWRKSLRSGDSNQCVEVSTSNNRAVIGVRDSKRPADAVLTFAPGDWHTFITEAKSGSFDR